MQPRLTDEGELTVSLLARALQTNIGGAMSVQTSAAIPTQTSARVCLALGVVAALLTTILGFISHALGAASLIVGLISWRRQSLSAPGAAGLAMAAVSIYVILLELFVVG